MSGKIRNWIFIIKTEHLSFKFSDLTAKSSVQYDPLYVKQSKQIKKSTSFSLLKIL